LKGFNDNVDRISDLHTRSINVTDEAAGERIAAELEELVEETGALSNTLKRRIKALERQGGPGRDGQIKKQQVREFVDCIPWFLGANARNRMAFALIYFIFRLGWSRPNS